MKKRLLWMAMAGVALVGCVNDEVADMKSQEQEKVLIQFDAPVAYANGKSRANFHGEIGSHTYGDTEKFPGTYSYPREENFMVGAKHYTGDSFVWGEATNFWGTNTEYLPVTWQGEANPSINGWKTTYDYYWPSGKLAFVAYSPADLENNNTEVEYTNSGWTVANFAVKDPGYQIDLLLSDLVTNASGNTAGGTGKYHGVPIKFRHALSAVHFVVMKPSTVDVDVVLTKIVLKNVNNMGDYDADGWDSSNPVEYTPYDDSNGLEFTYDGAHVGDNGGHSLLLMPQDLTNVTIDVFYTVGDNEREALDVSLCNVTGELDDNSTYTVTEWEPGKKYIYVLKYAASARDLIYFGPQTIDWEDIDIDIPLN